MTTQLCVDTFVDSNHFIQACLLTQKDLEQSMKVSHEAKKYDKMSKLGDALGRLVDLKQRFIRNGNTELHQELER